MPELETVGKSIVRTDAFEKVTGQARFTSDIKPAGMLYGKIVRSPHAHARILSIDAAKAKKLAGVRAVVTPEDMPREPVAPSLADQYVFCHDGIARCAGDPVAAVAADDPDIAEEAARLIKVDYQPLPAVFGSEDAFQPHPPVVVHPDLPRYRALGKMPIVLDSHRPNVCQIHNIECGDVTAGFRDADVVVENTFTTPRMHQCPLEPHVAIAWFEADGTLCVISSTQMIYETKGILARLFNLPPDRVRLFSAYIGGGFGAKGGARAEPVAALLARKSGRKVGIVFGHEEMFVSGGHKSSFDIRIKDGVKRDGALVARQMSIIMAIGAYSDKGVSVARRASGGAVGVYRIPNFKCTTFGVYNNLPLTGALRGFGSPDVEWAVEQQMDMIARQLNMDPVLFRKKNILDEGERNPNGMITRSIGVRECLDKVERWLSRDPGPARGDGRWKTGRSVTVGCKPSTGGSTSEVSVVVRPNGPIELRHSGTEIGQGLRTTLVQIAAEEFKVSAEHVTVAPLDTAYCGFDFGTVASRSLTHLGNATIAACGDARRQLFQLAAPILGAFDLDMSAGNIFVREAPARFVSIRDLLTASHEGLMEITGKGAYTGPGAPEDPVTGQSERPCFDHAYVASGVEVAVDVESGEVRVLRSGVACDVGRAINPTIVEGQIEGGDAMGMGSAISEEMVFDNEGVLANAGLRDYRIPRAMDVPTLQNGKAMIVEAAEPDGPFGAKGMGELPLVVTAAAIANAVFNATGARITGLPLSKKKVLEAIKSAEQSSSQTAGNVKPQINANEGRYHRPPRL